eukprot:TRINITY_DN2609_c0_g1_i1.p1 TRINITY_DN2609_c0_g1~~TRINITY_DN2609_c0_g1_i1.p1  ORF type:complete len:225 (-),score=0.77 TRINITY_DN2609_c0_g1_i1:229-903(-)
MDKFGVAILLVLCVSATVAQAQNFDFFYLVVQWPGAYCDTSNGCCYPTTGKPASDFSIHGLWPNYNDGSYPSNCDSSNPFQESLVQDLEPQLRVEWPTLACPSGTGVTFWQHEWEKHGTCSESVLNEHQYFQATLALRQQINFLGALNAAGIYPNDKKYSLTSIKSALTSGLGKTPGIECNKDPSGNSQLYQIYVCVDTDGSTIITCPVLPSGGCASSVQFAKF